jgi:hypothetical protein
MTPERYGCLCELFDRAQAMPPDRRAAFLEEVGAADPALAAELENMLADDQKAQGEPLFRGPFPVNAKALLSAAAVLPQRAGRYRIEGEISRGGMGVVLRARDPDLHRPLAIKVLLETHANQTDLERRFHAEAQITGQLQHPGIPPIYEVGVLADGRPFFAMKLIKGQTLAELLRQRRQPAEDLPRWLAIFAQVCQTLAYAHSKGVIHRDLKPSNVMVGAFAEVQVMDWGLAKLLSGDRCVTEGGAAEEASKVATVRSVAPEWASRAGALLGTPAYMAPEQARGEVDLLDERCDVFGLGAILCEVLTGQPPVAVGWGNAVLARAMGADVDDTVARLEGCGADAELVQLTRACLSVRREDRPRHAGVVAQAVGDYQAGVQERLRAAERERAAAEARADEEARTRQVAEAKAAAERRARRLAVLLAAVGLLLVTAVGGGAWWLRLRQQEAEAGRRDRRLLAALLEVRQPREGPRYQRTAEGSLMTLAEPSLDEQFVVAFRAGTWTWTACRPREPRRGCGDAPPGW